MWRIAMTWNWELHGDGSEPVVTIRNKHSLTGYFKVPRVPRVPKVPRFWLVTYSHMLRPPNPQGYPKRPWEVFATLPPHWRPWRHGGRPRNGRSRLPQWPFGLTLPKAHDEALEQRCLRSIEISGLGDPDVSDWFLGFPVWNGDEIEISWDLHRHDMEYCNGISLCKSGGWGKW